MLDFSTINIFGFRKIRIIRQEGRSGSINLNAVPEAIPVIENIKSLVPEGTTPIDYQKISILNGSHAIYSGKAVDNQDQVDYIVKFEDLDINLLTALVNGIVDAGL